MSKRICVQCGAELYPSTSKGNEGKLEHFCAATQGIVIIDPEFPEELTKEKTEEFTQAKKQEEKTKKEEEKKKPKDDSKDKTKP